MFMCIGLRVYLPGVFSKQLVEFKYGSKDTSIKRCCIMMKFTVFVTVCLILINYLCLTHTHHIGIDTQLFLLSPLMVFLIWKWPKRGIVLLTIWAIISTVMRYYVTYTQRLSNYIHYGTSIQQLFSTADNMYILPSHRVTVYVMGILLGCSLQHYRKVQLSSLFLGNTIALLSFSSSLIGPAFMGDITYIYRPVDAACYAAFAPILWCMSFAWVIFTTHYGYLNSLGKLFSWKGFRIWTKISYAVYLTQFPIFFYNVGVTRTSDYYGFFSKNFNFGECLWICILSALLTILFELPFQNIRNIMLRKIPETAKQKNNIQQH